VNEHIFQFLFDGYNTTLMQGVNNATSQALSLAAGVMQVIMAFFVAGYAIQILVGRASWHNVGWFMFKAGCVIAILMPAHYNAWVRDTFVNDLPNWSAQVSGLGITTNNMAAVFDNVHNGTVKMLADVRGQATGLLYISERIEIALAGFIAFIALLAAFIVWFLARIVTALIIPLGPFLLPGYLWESTRGFADRWFGKLVGLALLTILVHVLLGVVVTQEQAYMHTLGNAGNDVVAMIQTLWDLALVFVCGAFMMVILPSIAAYIGGSVGFSGSGIIGGIALGARMAGGSFRSRK
jgi:type IV secretion system protein VirB6